ncbi:hypothetical protein [Streptomyces niveus]
MTAAFKPHQADVNLAKALDGSLLTAKGTTHHRRVEGWLLRSSH